MLFILCLVMLNVWFEFLRLFGEGDSLRLVFIIKKLGDSDVV